MIRKFEAWVWSAALLTVLLSAIVHAAIYKWTDENGMVHYSDRLPAEDAEQLDVDTGASGTGPSLIELLQNQLVQPSGHPDLNWSQKGVLYYVCLLLPYWHVSV
tara:strand:+ start:1044 stop:1355 length:312 start_codon:yes stop_codon:yes gene_type:complete